MNITTKIVREVGFSEFERAVSEFHGAPYSVVCAIEGRNDMEYAFEADGSDLDPWDVEDLEKWKVSGMEGYSPRPVIVLDPMVKAGVVPAGEYLIKICW